jgi:hypothetical protein
MGLQKVPGTAIYMAEVPNEFSWTITGRGVTIQECTNMAKAIADASDGTVLASYQAIPLAVIDLPAPTATGAKSDAVLLFTKGQKRRTLRINNIQNGLTKPGKVVDLNAPLIIALAAAFRDELGIGGYTLASGKVTA